LETQKANRVFLSNEKSKESSGCFERQ